MKISSRYAVITLPPIGHKMCWVADKLSDKSSKWSRMSIYVRGVL